MSTPPSGGNNLWRDLAAGVVQDVADRLRADRERRAAAPTPQEKNRPSDLGAATGSLGREIRDLVVSSVRATSSSIADYQADKERRQAERERRLAEAPLRKAEARAKRAKVGAIALGVLATSGFVGSVQTIADGEGAGDVAASIAVTVAFAGGTVAVGRSSRRHREEAEAHARRLGATSAMPVDFNAPATHSIVLPDRSSVAYEPTRRLIAQKQALALLLPDVEGIAPDLRTLAIESEGVLAAYADRIIKLERARAAANGSTALDAPLHSAVEQYEDGVDAHQKLLEAAAAVMAEMTAPDVGGAAHQSIDDAADRLQGLAEGLRQVRHDIPMPGSVRHQQAPPRPQAAPAPPPYAAPIPRESPRGRGLRNRRRNTAD